MLMAPKGITHRPVPASVEEVGRKVPDAAFKVRTTLGPGLLESVHVACLAYEIRKSGFAVETQATLPVIYDDVKVDAGLRLDVLVEKYVIMERSRFKI